MKKFKYLGAMDLDEGSKPEVIARIAMTAATLTKLDIIWKDKIIKDKTHAFSGKLVFLGL